MKKKIKIKDIAKELGISPSAVSLALNNKAGIGQNLRAAIKDIACKSGYIKRNSTLNSKYIATLYSRAGGHIITAIDMGVKSVFKKLGYLEIRGAMDVEDITSDTKKQIYFDSIANESSIAGVIILFINVSEIQVSSLVRNRTPMVFLNGYCQHGSRVFIDDQMGGYLAAKKFIELGHRNIGFINPEVWYDTIWNQRKRGFKDALIEANIMYMPSMVAGESLFSFEGVRNAVLKLLDAHPKTTAILFSSDLQALYGIKAMNERGIKVPDDISVIGFDDIDFCQFTSPTLSSVHMPFWELGRTGAQILLERITGKTKEDKQVRLQPDIILRDSCRKI